MISYPHVLRRRGKTHLRGGRDARGGRVVRHRAGGKRRGGRARRLRSGQLLLASIETSGQLSPMSRTLPSPETSRRWTGRSPRGGDGRAAAEKPGSRLRVRRTPDAQRQKEAETMLARCEERRREGEREERSGGRRGSIGKKPNVRRSSTRIGRAGLASHAAALHCVTEQPLPQWQRPGHSVIGVHASMAARVSR